MKEDKTFNQTIVLVVVAMLVMLPVQFLYAQSSNSKSPKSVNQSGYRITGQVVDLEDYAPLRNVNVQLLRTDSTQIQTVQTNDNGDYAFFVERKKTDYIVKVSCVGFTTRHKAVHVAGKTTLVDAIRLEQDMQLLADVEVTGNLPRVQAVEDTLIYNADAYRLPEGSVLEELIERLPGAEVEDGKVTINGKQVQKILLDGKEFFLGDMNTALKNIPTSVIDKLKHYEEKSDMAKVTGIDDGQEKPVIDVRIKKGMNKGYNLTADGAYGTHDRYSGRLNGNIFEQKSRITLTGNSNNANDRSTPGRGGRGGSNGMGGGSNGLRTSHNAGFDFNFDDRKTLQMNGNVRWNASRSDADSKSSVENFISRTGAFSNSISKSRGENMGVSGEFRLEWKPTEDWNIQLRPSAGYSSNDRMQRSANASFNHDPYNYVDDAFAYLDVLGSNDLKAPEGDTISVNSRNNVSVSGGDSYNAGASLQVNRKFGSDGRNLTFRAEGSYSNSASNSVSQNKTHFYRLRDYLGNDSLRYTNRFNDNPSHNKNYSMQVSYSEPIFQATFLQFSYRFQYSNNYSDRDTYDFSQLRGDFAAGVRPELGNWEDFIAGVPGGYEAYLSDSLSRFSEYRNFTHDLNLMLRLNRTKYNLSVGVRYVPQTSHFNQKYLKLDTSVVRTTYNITPTLTFRYRFSRQHTLNVDYHGNSSQPSITQLLDITDDSNPLNVTHGNPGLKPSFTNQLRLQYNNYIVDRRQSYAGNVNFQTTSNSISNMVRYDDESGKRETKPENINGNWNMRGYFTFTSALDRDAAYNVSTSTDVGYQHHVSYVTLNRNSSSVENVTHTTTASERLSGSYRNTWLEVELNGRANYTRGRNVLQANGNRDTWQFSYGCSFNFKLPWEMTIDTSINNASRRGFSDASFNTDELIWNAQVSQSFLPRKRLVVTLQFYDILNQQSNYSRQISANRRSDTWYNSINSYAMLHVVYQLRNFGGRNGRIGNGRNGGGFAGGNGGGRGGNGGNGGGRSGGNRGGM